MPAILNIITRRTPSIGLDDLPILPPHPLPPTHESDPVSFVRFDLTQPAPDYNALLEAIFAAEAVHVW